MSRREIERLKKLNNFGIVHSSKYFQKHFVERYYGKIPKMAFELFGISLTYQQVDVVEHHDYHQGRLVVPSGHGTGKTANIGVISACFLLLFPYSITRIQAPSEAQITNFSFKEIENCFTLLSSYRRVDGKLVRSKWHWLAKFVQFNAKKIFVKGFSRSWYIEAKTAPKGKSENLSGQHKWAYQLVVDEASGVEDEHINASMGALSNYFNSAILFSQHTRLTGLFHDFVTVQNKDNGGLWSCVRLNSEQSPIVDVSSIKNWRDTYNESQYAVRVNGLPPLYVEGNLISPLEALQTFDKKGKDWIDRVNFNTLVVSVDTAYRAIRDSSVVTVAKVAKVGNNIYIYIIAIAVFHGENAKMPIETAEEAIKMFLKYEHIGMEKTIICYDATSGGREGFTRLEKRFGFAPINMNDDLEQHMTVIERDNLDVVPIVWGSDRIVGADKKDYTNARDKAFGGLQRAVMNDKDNLYIADNRYKTRVVREMSNIPFKYTPKGQLKIAPKEDFETGSPDIVDTIAQMYLLDYDEVDEAEIVKSKAVVVKEIQSNLNLDDYYSYLED